MIPKIIWQTYKDEFDDLPKYIRHSAQTWMDKNPSWEYRYVSDKDAAEFVREHYGEEYYEIFNSLPIGVMRGDMWRYLVMYIHGGVYADLDTICNKPISRWLTEGYDMIISTEHSMNFCQWTFACSPKNKIIKSVIDLMMERLRSPNYEMREFVHYHTGPMMWTQGIYNALGLEIKPFCFDIQGEKLFCNSLIGSGRCSHGALMELSESLNGSDLLKENGLYIYGEKNWKIFRNGAVSHIFGSQQWKEGYTSWTNEDMVRKNGR
jgi:mannosyltransferase OCH1-like enzyme